MNNNTIILSFGLSGSRGSKKWIDEPIQNREIEKAKEFIVDVKFKKLKKISNHSSASYELKHLAEEYLRLKYSNTKNKHRHDFYITNGAFIETMRQLGYKYKRVDNGSPKKYELFI